MGNDNNQRFGPRQPFPSPTGPSTDARTANRPATSASAPASADAPLAVTLPTITAPKGGGAIRSLFRGRIYNSTEYAAGQSIPLHCEASYLPATAKGVGITVRHLPGTSYVRASVGAWNDESDLERLLASL